MSSNAHLDTGKWGELVAEKFLRKKGLKLVGRRVRVGARDEIDLIMRKGNLLVFVEVKTRANERYGRPVGRVDSRKKHAISRAAVRFIKQKRIRNMDLRFDVVEVVGRQQSNVSPVVRHIENAFVLDRCYDLP